MNISTDKIAEQWSHRVGIIDKNDPLHIIELKKILNRHKLEESVIDQYVSNLLGEKERIYERDFHEKNILLEALAKGEYKQLSNAALAMGKTIQLNMFLKGTTTEAGKLIKSTLDKFEAEQKKLEKKNKGLKPTSNKYKVGKTCKDFLKILHSKNNVENLKSVPGSGIEKDIFELGGGTGQPGRGEVWASVMVPNTVVSGTSKSYDLTSPGGNYEVKDNRKGGSIRLGVHATLGNFVWWKEVVKTSNIVKKILSNKQLLNILQPLYGGKADLLILALQNINDRIAATVAKGAFGAKDIGFHDRFYEVASEFGQSPIEGYTEVQFHGPNRQPAVRAITPLGKDEIPTKGKVSVELLSKQPNELIDGLRTQLNSLKYVRDPASFVVDRDQSVKDIAAAYGKYNAIFMIFKGGKVHYVDPQIFKYKESSQGKVKVIW